MDALAYSTPVVSHCRSVVQARVPRARVLRNRLHRARPHTAAPGDGCMARQERPVLQVHRHGSDMEQYIRVGGHGRFNVA